jgi:riboflavin synthase
MFTGLVVERGRLIADPRPSGRGGVRLEIAHSAVLSTRLPVGASLSVSGVCLTILAPLAAASLVELSPETLSRTTLGSLRRGDEVNLEPALRLGDALGGHWVQGHVDGVAEVIGRRDLTEHRLLELSLPAAPPLLLVEKGSITVDGVSLTVAALAKDRFEVALIPHTLEMTTLGERVPGDRVNLEADVLGKYVQRILGERGLVPAMKEGGG